MQRCKGTRDLLPEDMLRFQEVVEVFRSSCLAWGYREVKTPTLEYLHLFTATGTLTPSMLHKVYSFLDWDGWSGERVVLRPEATIPAARLYVDNLSTKPLAKLSYLENIFSFHLVFCKPETDTIHFRSKSLIEDLLRSCVIFETFLNQFLLRLHWCQACS